MEIDNFYIHLNMPDIPVTPKELESQRNLDLARQQAMLQAQETGAGDEGAEKEEQEEEEDQETKSLMEKKPEELNEKERQYLFEMAEKKDKEAEEASEKANDPDPPLAVRILKAIADGFDAVASAIGWIFDLIPVIGMAIKWLIKGTVKIPTTIIRFIADRLHKTHKESQEKKAKKATKEAQQLRQRVGESKAKEAAKGKTKTIRLWPGGPVLPKWNIQLIKGLALVGGVMTGVAGFGGGVGILGAMCKQEILKCAEIGLKVFWEAIKGLF